MTLLRGLGLASTRIPLYGDFLFFFEGGPGFAGDLVPFNMVIFFVFFIFFFVLCGSVYKQ